MLSGFFIFIPMKKEELRIVFMGTPDFAVGTLKALVDNGFHVVGVVTAPDRPAGRGKQLTSPAVKTAAMRWNIPVLQPEKLKNEAFLEQLAMLKTHIQIVVAFRMLPEVVWNMPPMGTFNLHASLLPQYRGAAPINHALMNGETVTGVTTFMLDHEIDTGKILLQERVDIAHDDDAESLHDKLMETGARLVVTTLEAILTDSLIPRTQEELIQTVGSLKTAPKIFKADCYIPWNEPGEKVYNFIRGLSPYPAALTQLLKPDSEPIPIKIYRTHFLPEPHAFVPGRIYCPDKRTLHVAVSNGWIVVEEIQQAGKKRMKTDEFLRGVGSLSGMQFG